MSQSLAVDKVTNDISGQFSWFKSVLYLPMWPSGQSTRAPSDALRSRGSNLSLGTSAYQRIISNNSYAHNKQGDNPGQERGFDSVIYKL